MAALQRHGFAHAHGFRDGSFSGLTIARLAESAGLSRPSVYAVQDAYGDLFLDPLRLRPDVGYAVGVELGPRNARVAIADIHGQLFAPREDYKEYFALMRPPEEYLDWVAPSIDALVRAAGVEPSEVIGIGISQVAPINTSTGHPHPSGLTNKAWRDVNVGDQLARRLVALRGDWEGVRTGPSDNDTNLSLLAEHTFGSVVGVDDVLFVNWSNHVGFGLILAGRPYRGSRGYAGELGHLLIGDERGTTRRRRTVEGRCARCGKVGCLEVRVGASWLAEEFEASEDELIDAADYVLARIDAREVGYDNDERRRVHDAARLLGESVASVVDTLDPAALILGGSIGERIHDDTALLWAFREGLEERMMGFAHDIEIRQPKLKTSAVQGAALRVLTEHLPEWARHRIATATSSGRDTSPDLKSNSD